MSSLAAGILLGLFLLWLLLRQEKRQESLATTAAPAQTPPAPAPH